MTGLVKMYQNWREHVRIDAEIESFPDSELEGLGLSREDFRDIAHMPAEQVARMEQAAAILGVPAGTLARDAELRLDVARTCAHCNENGRCKHAMRAGATPEMLQDFCPNAEIYAEVAKAG